MLAGAVTSAALMAGYGTAMAQVVIETRPADVYVATPGAYDPDYYAYRTGPRVYGYTRYYRDVDDGDAIIVERPAYRGGCGTYHYWNGVRCVDARR